MVESSLHCNKSFHLFLVRVLFMEFHCNLQLLDGFRTVNAIASVAGG